MTRNVLSRPLGLALPLLVLAVLVIVACGGGDNGGSSDGTETGPRPLTLLRCSEDRSQCAVVLIASDGSDATRVTDWLDGGIGNLVWSANGRELTFEAVGEDETFGTQVTDAGSFEYELLFERFQVFWSPDRSRIAYLGGTGEAEGEIYVADADGSNARQLTTDGGFIRNLEWSPDGRLVLYGLRTDTPGGGPIRSTLWIAAADGSDPAEVAEDVVSRGRWSPKGDRIVFAGVSSEDDGESDLYTVAPDGSDVVNLTNEPAGYFGPAWSPDGKSIAFYSDRESDEESFETSWHVFMMSGDGTGLIRVTGDSFELMPSGDPVVWSPAGTAVAFTAFDRAFSSESAVVASADGSGHTRLTYGFTSDRVVAWTEVSSEVWPSESGQSELETYIWEFERIFGRAFDRLNLEVNPRIQEASDLVDGFGFGDGEDLDEAVAEAVDQMMDIGIEAGKLGVDTMRELQDDLGALDPPAELEDANRDIIEAMRPVEALLQEMIILFESVETPEDVMALEMPDETAVNEASELLDTACTEIQRALDENDIPIEMGC